jgi:outer membrane protein, heavy metal efflux system
MPRIAPAQTTNRLSLTDALGMALHNNPDVLRAQLEITTSDGRILQAGSIPNPEFELGLSEVPTSFNVREAGEWEFGIRQSIEFPTKRSSRIDVAELDKDIAELQLERTKTLVTAQVKKAYYGVLFGQEIVRGLEGQLSLLRDFQQLVQSRFAAAASSYLDVVRSKVEIARTTNDLTDARRETQLRATQLNLLLGRSSDASLHLADSLSYAPLLLNNDSLVEQRQTRSAALAIVQATVARQQCVLGLAGTGYLPDFSIGISHHRIAEQPPFNANNFAGVTTNSLGIQVGISVPLWFWQEPRGQVREAEALVEIARVSVAATARHIRANIVNALRAVNDAEAQLQVFDRSLLSDANDILKTGIDQYRNNQIDVLNLVDIYRTYRATRVEYLRALTNSLVARADLDAASELMAE